MIREHEPQEGYQVCISAGGKDSEVVEHLARAAGVKYDLVYSLTGIDPPEAVKFMKEQYPNVIIQKPVMSLFRGIETHGLPRRNARWCCELLKEFSGDGRVCITGIRAEESTRRRQRRQVEISRDDTVYDWAMFNFEKYLADKPKARMFVHPILGWSEMEVWEYIDGNNLPYCSLYDIDGWDRLGCIMCPFATWRKTLNDWARYPKIANAWFRAGARYYRKIKPRWVEKAPELLERFKTVDIYLYWWLTRGQISIEGIKYEIEKRGLKMNIEGI